MQSAIADFQRDPSVFGWNAVLTERDERILEALKNTTPSTWKKLFLRGPLAEGRPIAVWGPSGTGKSIISSHLAGGSPRYAPESSSTMEHGKLVAGWRGYNIITAPGSGEQDSDGSTIKLKNTIISKKPPKVFCFMVSAGYHATNSPPLMNSFRRPGSKGKEVADNIDDFRSECFKEEIAMLQELLKHSHGNMKVRIPAFITVINKKDLWMASGSEKEVIDRYNNIDSEYVKIVSEICQCWGLGLTQSVHEVYVSYSFPGGFHPDTSVNARALTAENAAADAMLLRALVYYHYTDGAGA